MQSRTTQGCAAVARLLLDSGAKISPSDDSNIWPPLVYACYRGHIETAKILIEYGAGTTENDSNPIHYAGQRKHRICQLLVQNRAIDDLISPENALALALFRAAYSYDYKAVEEILSSEPELVHFRDRHKRIALHETCTHGDTRTVKVLLRFGANNSAVDDRGQTPLDRANAHRQHRIAQLLANN